jgi:orotate phosphoribosyltransferase
MQAIRSRLKKVKPIYSVYKAFQVQVAKSDNRVVRRLDARRRKTFGLKWFISYADAHADIQDWLKDLPRDFDMIVGIPRSGMFIASVLSLQLVKPVASLDGAIDGKCWNPPAVDAVSGSHHILGSGLPGKNVLLVDDSVSSIHGTMEKAYSRLISKGFTVRTAVLYVTEETKNVVNFYHRVIPPIPHRFEWNLMRAYTGYTASDLDGVLCEDCPEGVDLDEPKYVEWLRNAKPFLIPRYTLDLIISSRLEKYRELTVDWLRRNGVSYNHLVLWDLQDKSMRTFKGHVDFKAKMLGRFKPDWYWESSPEEAVQIAEKTGIPCLCIRNMALYS